MSRCRDKGIGVMLARRRALMHTYLSPVWEVTAAGTDRGEVSTNYVCMEFAVAISPLEEQVGGLLR